MNFHETQMGYEFYGKTVPRIAKALEQVAKSLDKTALVAGLPYACEVPADFLSELYQGNYDPSDEPDTDEVSRCSAEILANETALRAAVPPDIWEQIDHTFSLMNKRGDGQREQAFAAGYRTAMMMVMAGLSPAPRSGS
jgi:hypothetical protein